VGGLIDLIEFMAHVLGRCKEGRECIEELVKCVEEGDAAAPSVTAMVCYRVFVGCLRRLCCLWL